MEINYIREFAVLAEIGNYLEAAESLFISQSSLSKHIQMLEKELGTPLFNRSTRKVELNEYGLMFLPYAKQIAQLQLNYLNDFYNKLNQVKDTITIGTEYRILELLTAFHKYSTKFSLNVIESTSEGDIIDLVKKGKCDLGFVIYKGEKEEDMVMLPYETDQFVAVLPVDHPLAKRKSITLKEIAEEDFILLPEKSGDTNFIKRACRNAGFEPKISFTGFRGNNIVDFVKQGLGISILTKKSVSNLLTPEITLVDITPELVSHINICYRKNSKLSEGAKHFINFASS